MKKAAFVALLIAACGPSMRGGGGGGDDGTDANNGSGSGSEQPRQCDKMDIVFVVDDSGSMAEEQNNLATNFPMFANLLSTYTVNNGQPLDFRVAVTTTGRTVDYTISIPGFGSIPQHETGDNGAFKNNCSVASRWLDKADPQMSSHLACRAKVGTSGPSVEMPMLMAKYALGDRVADNTNAGFIRSDALLAIVMITDEDDWSNSMDGFTVDATGNSPRNFDPPDLINFLDTTKGNRSRWAAAAIAGDGNCSSSFGMATDATRLKQFTQMAGNNGVFSSICAGDLTIGLKKALDTFQAACGNIIL